MLNVTQNRRPIQRIDCLVEKQCWSDEAGLGTVSGKKHVCKTMLVQECCVGENWKNAFVTVLQNGTVHPMPVTNEQLHGFDIAE